jgi:hypothetical protein
MSKRAPPKYQAILDKYAPPLITVHYKRGRKIWEIWGELHRARVYVPRPYSKKALAFGLHEFAHFYMKHFNEHGTKKYKPTPTLVKLYSGNDKISRAQEEYEAETWVIATMQREGISVPADVRKTMTKYVEYCIRRHGPKDEKKGWKTPSRVRRFASRIY